MSPAEQELESLRFRRGIVSAQRRHEHRKVLSYRLGYVCGRLAVYWRILATLFRHS